MIYPPKLNRYQLELEEVNLSEAYSDLKGKYLDLKRRLSVSRESNKQLTQELKDYKERYDHLIKYLNEREENN